MRRESSTVVSVVGEVRDALLAQLATTPNVSVARPQADGSGAGGELETAVAALRQATGKASSFVLVPADPLAGVASQWRDMWDLSHGPRGSAAFEARVGDALAAWRAGRFELPDYYLVLAPAPTAGPGHDAPTGSGPVAAGAAAGAGGPAAGGSAAGGSAAGGHAGEGAGPDFYLGPLRAARPHRVAVALTPAAERPGPPRAGHVLDALRRLEHGPWWPPLDEVIDTARRFFAGGLAGAPSAVARGTVASGTEAPGTEAPGTEAPGTEAPPHSS
jgi:hypothetical protein